MNERHLRVLAGLASGLLFGVGLVVSGMTDPAKVLNFLDFFGSWDASLAFVMAGAVATSFVGYRLAWRRQKPLFDAKFQLPGLTSIDRTLMTGAAIFGLGWGFSGFCPGPALTSLPLMADGTLVFVLAMVLGMWLARFAPRLD